MSKVKEFVYEVNERSIDVRYFEIVSDKKLSHNEVIEAICLPDISKEGDSKKEVELHQLLCGLTLEKVKM